MKKIFLKLILIFATLLFTGCAKDNITITDVALSPVYVVLGVGALATQATVLAATAPIALVKKTADVAFDTNKSSDENIEIK